MFLKVFLVCIVLKLVSSIEIRNDEEEFCYSTEDEEPGYSQFSTKTAYEKIKGNISQIDGIEPACRPVKIWLLIRNGAMHPSQSTLDELAKLSVVRNNIPDEDPGVRKLCSEDWGELKVWNGIGEKNADVLSSQGEEELQTLALEYRRTFPQLFDKPENFLFRHPDDDILIESFQRFAAALFPVEDINAANVTEENTLLKFYEYCNKWQDNNEMQNRTDSELSIFESSDHFIKIKKEITDRLGLSNELTLTPEQVNNIWDMCRFDRAWNNSLKSPWCYALAPDHINVLEHREDIKNYYMAGHANEINRRVGCKTVVDMLDHLRSENEQQQKVIANFVDEITIQLFLTALGVDKEKDSPNANNFDTEIDGKPRWKSSKISPFASNLAVVKYDCPGDKDAVQFFLNEKLIEFDWCNGTCTLTAVMNEYHLYEEVNCEDYFCSGEPKIVFAVFTMIMNLILIYLY